MGVRLKVQLMQQEREFGEAAEAMVDRQIRARGIHSPAVLRAMRAVPRHLFVAESLCDQAYADQALPTRHGQTISQPYIVALMSELLGPAADHRVLEIGTGSGYQTAILARLARSVLTIESDAELVEEARTRLEHLRIGNVEIRQGDGSLGAADRAPFDRIIVTAGAPTLPEPLKQQLADGGRMVIPVGDDAVQTMTVIERQGDSFESHASIRCRFVPLVGRYAWKHGRLGP
jgi:protein-L-isoaspartate(D-aspartate) O-methyltransferase